jgi:methionyl-tRNA formyltransferase
VKILYLGPFRADMIRYLSSYGDEVIHAEGRIFRDSTVLQDIGFIISYGYRFIISPEIVARFPNRIVNLHISYLPWNKGADPNLWSFLEDTPKGVTIHYVDEGLDTGEIIAQQKVHYRIDDTLRTTYERLSQRIEGLFREIWPELKQGRLQSTRQEAEGSFHLKKDKEKYQHLLTNGWDTPVINLIGKAIIGGSYGQMHKHFASKDWERA